MARRTFFSFHYEADIFRANQVRNSNVVRPNSSDGDVFFDASLWEEAKKKGEDALKRLIKDGLRNTSVTAVLVGSETAARRWVLYEIEQSFNKGNGLLGIRIHNVKDINGKITTAGANPFDSFTYTEGPDKGLKLSKRVKLYDWVLQDGYSNLPKWIEDAWKQVNG